MAIHCPYCQQTMELKGAHPGHYSPKCTACHGKFSLHIPDGENAAPFVKAIPGGEPQATAIEAALGLEEPEPPVRKKVAAANHQPTSAGSNRHSTTQAQLHAKANIAATAIPHPAQHAAKTDRTHATVATAAQATVSPVARATVATTAHTPVAHATPTSDHAARATAIPISPASTHHAAEVTAIPLAPEPPSAAAPIAMVTSVAAPFVAPPAEAPMEDIQLTGTLGGYEVKQKLGQGGMGAVFLARQVSLDRDVAIKILSPKLAADPQFISRFTREAYAAAQLTHHNVVQIHDIGVDKNLNYFSMEFVEGNSLSGVVKENGKLDPEVAVGYVLQAARGLKFAHDHGMVHRDVKPDNLLLNDDGIVKVADLGLVKRAGVSETAPTANVLDGGAGSTQINMSMGTPAYMPPEQAMDAAHVDQRADIYSLGCTLYDLLTGRPPFVGHTGMEVITKHAREAITPPDRLAKHVPAVLSTICMKMMAKKLEERYQKMGDVIAALETFLGVDSGKVFIPKEEHVKVLEFAAQRFNGSKFATMRSWIIRGFFAITLLATIICALPMVGHPLIAGGLVGFAVLTTLVYQITVGVTQRTFVFKKFRQLIFGASIIDWLKYLTLIAAVVGILVAFNLHFVWLGFGVLAVGAAMAFHFTIDLLAARDRATPVQQVEAMLKQMRLRGLDENALRHFVCQYAGDKWEEFYEALFGYESKITARRLWGKTERGRERAKHAAWRDAFIAWVDHKQLLRKESKERQILAKLEAKALQAKGIDIKLAEQQAKKSAERMVDKAAHLKESAVRRAAVTAIPGKIKMDLSELEMIRANFMDDDSHHIKFEHRRESYFKRRFGGPLDVAFGKQVRFVLAAMLLAGFAMWWNVNGGWELKKNAAEVMATSEDPTAIVARKVITTAKEQTKTAELQSKKKMEPLRLNMVPDAICDLLGSWSAGLAGAILALSLLFAGKVLGVMTIFSAFVALIGHKLKLPILYDQAWLAATIALGLAIFAMVFFRERKGA